MWGVTWVCFLHHFIRVGVILFGYSLQRMSEKLRLGWNGCIGYFQVCVPQKYVNDTVLTVKTWSSLEHFVNVQFEKWKGTFLSFTQIFESVNALFGCYLIVYFFKVYVIKLIKEESIAIKLTVSQNFVTILGTSGEKWFNLDNEMYKTVHLSK